MPSAATAMPMSKLVSPIITARSACAPLSFRQDRIIPGAGLDGCPSAQWVAVK